MKANPFNAFMTWLLRSPLHGIVSGHFMLITVTGRKTGTQYTTPVEYGLDQGAVLVVSAQSRTWWRNLRDKAPCVMHIGGQDVKGTATIATDVEAVRETLRRIYPKMSAQQITMLAPKYLALRITPLTPLSKN
ncbi:MAG: nitroreductase family deazaflavin-dependent oxidoreductase [Anaerolineae bacterium]|nr:nitroreductase family deazaflavin-dependent oxidoreductase [Anaerolineae bacterium]